MGEKCVNPYVLVEEFTADTLAQYEWKIGTDLDVGLGDKFMIGTDLVAVVFGVPSLQMKLAAFRKGRHQFRILSVFADIGHTGNFKAQIAEIHSRFQLLQTFPHIFKGGHVDNPAIRTQFIEQFKATREDPFIMNVDGEVELGYDPDLRIHPGFFNVFMPKERLSE